MWQQTMNGLRIWGAGMLFALLAACGGGSDNGIASDNGVAIRGRVTAASSGEWLEGVEIYTQKDGILARTDATGRFMFRVPPNTQRTLRLRATGYTSQSLPVSVGTESRALLVTLRKRKSAIRIPNAEQGFEYTDPSGARVIIPDSSLYYRDAQGQEQPVIGDVLLQVTPVNVASDAELEAFPGRFAGTDMNGNPAPVILSYGTVEFRFSLPDGTPVNLGTGPTANPAIIEIPVFVSQYPDGTPIRIGDAGQAVWYLDEASGLWRQESADGVVVESPFSPTGMALRATVNHFSWWNHDVSVNGCQTRFMITGLPEKGGVIIKARTRTGGGPRFANRVVSGDQEVRLYIPDGMTVEMEAEANTRLGLYRARPLRFVGCEKTPAGTIKDQIIDFTGGGPQAPVIHAFDVTTRPVLEKVGGQYTVVSNRIHGVFNVSGLVDDPDVASLVVTMRGSDGRDVPLTPYRNTVSATVNEDKLLRLVARNAAAGATAEVPVKYVAAQAPILSFMRYVYEPANAAYRLYFSVYGADRVNYGYVNSADADLTNANQVASVTTENPQGGILVPESGMPGPVDLYLELVNQYGTTVYRLRATNDCIVRPGLSLPRYCGIAGY